MNTDVKKVRPFFLSAYFTYPPSPPKKKSVKIVLVLFCTRSLVQATQCLTQLYMLYKCYLTKVENLQIAAWFHIVFRFCLQLHPTLVLEGGLGGGVLSQSA